MQARNLRRAAIVGIMSPLYSIDARRDGIDRSQRGDLFSRETIYRWMRRFMRSVLGIDSRSYILADSYLYS